MRIMVLGDTHGNGDWLAYYIYPTAMALDVDRIVQVGDFGYWEHKANGVWFLNETSRIATVAGIPLYWLRGNHDKSSLAHTLYHDVEDPEGFLEVRKNVLYIPDGKSWSWEGHTFRAFGGAYSVDKNWRLQQELLNHEHLLRKEKYRAEAAGRPPAQVDDCVGSLWFPEEEMTDADMDALLADSSEPVDVVFSHDKPRSTDPGWNRKELPLCVPNQDRLQRALEAHRPTYWLHGHLHHHYVQKTPSGGNSVTTVISLEPDDAAAEVNWKRHQTWCLLDLLPSGRVNAVLGVDAKFAIDADRMEAAKTLILNRA